MPLPDGRRPVLIRAANVLRQYAEDEVPAVWARLTGRLAPGATSIDAGRLGTIAIAGDQILLGKPFVFTKENVDGFDF